jgi:hypothetical protein
MKDTWNLIESPLFRAGGSIFVSDATSIVDGDTAIEESVLWTSVPVWTIRSGSGTSSGSASILLFIHPSVFDTQTHLEGIEGQRNHAFAAGT